MNQEIELKFVLHPDHSEALLHELTVLSAEHLPTRSLISVYYETADNQLHQHGMGLRVRQENDHYVMTMKLAGRVTGGLCQRPEYNVPLASPQPDLCLLPVEIWPAGIDPVVCQQAIQPLFTTCFQREVWCISKGDSRIEVALDQGEINARDRRENLCELELELLEGEIADVLALAEKLTALPGLRPGGLSKAARGYYLAQQQEYPLKPLEILRLPGKSSTERGLEASLDLAMAHWLYHKEVWLRGNAAAKNEVRHALYLIRHSLTLFGCIVPRKASTLLRDLLSRCEALLTDDATAEQVTFSQQNNEMCLALTRWQVFRGWRGFLDEKASAKIADSFKRFGDIQLSRLTAELKTAFSPSHASHYRDQLPRLERGLDCVYLLAGAYSGERVESWLKNWLMLYQAISTDQRSEIDRYRQRAVSQPPFWLHSGKKV